MSAEAQRRYKERHPDRVRASQLAYEATERGRETRQAGRMAYDATEKGRANRQRKRQRETTEQRLAWDAVETAIRHGVLTRRPCHCGAVAHAHHPNGYVDGHELDVVWLCPKHHRLAHRAER